MFVTQQISKSSTYPGLPRDLLEPVQNENAEFFVQKLLGGHLGGLVDLSFRVLIFTRVMIPGS